MAPFIVHYARERWASAASWSLKSSRLLLQHPYPHPSFLRRCFSAPVAVAAAGAKLKLRSYQEECIQSVLESLKSGTKRLGISLATGSGKTVIFTQLVSRVAAPSPSATRTLIIAHRRELVQQAAKHCNVAYPDLRVEVEMGPMHATGTADITIASLQSLTAKDRLHKYDPPRFKLLLVDEAHHIVSPGYLRVLRHFGLGDARRDDGNKDDDDDDDGGGGGEGAGGDTGSGLEVNTLGDQRNHSPTAAFSLDNDPRAASPALVGVSATFSRFDGLRLGVAIDEIVYHKDYVDMIGDKWLSDVIFTTVESSADLSKVRSRSNGEFNTGELSSAVNTDEINEITVRSWLAKAGDRHSTLVFCVDLAHVTGLTRRFRHHGIDARFVTGDTPKIQRGNTLDAFRQGEFPVLVNCGVFTEGTDIPNIDCVLMARPTKSRNLLIQMIGRGMRLHPDKANCHVIDMVSSLNTGIVTTPTLFGLDPHLIVHGASVKDLEAAKARREAEAARAEIAYGNGDGTTPVPDALPSEKATVTFTEYSSVFDLITDTSGEKHIHAISQHAWVQIGLDRFILCGPTGSYIRIERLDDDNPHLPLPPPSSSSSSSSSPEYPPTSPDLADLNSNISGITPTAADLARQPPIYRAVEVRALPPELAHGKAKTMYARPREILRVATFGDAVRGSDNYAAQLFPRTFIHRYQPWRRNPATQGQLDFLNKLRPEGDALTAETLTKGRAMDMITKLKHGARGRFSQLQQQQKKRQRADLREKRKASREKVSVGPLSA